MTQVLDWHMKFNFGRPRNTGSLRNVFIHTTENGPSTSAEAVANFQITSQSGSYHELVDREKVLIENTDDWVTWSTGNLGNDIGLHISIVARAAMKRAEWLDEEQRYGTLSRTARRVARWCRAYDIPPVFVDSAGLKAGKKGISTHDAARVWGNTDHWDPGPGFPMDKFLELVIAALNPPAKVEKETAMFTDADRKKLEAIYHELTHRFESRADLAAGKTPAFKDTAIGYALEADRKLELAPGTKLGDMFQTVLDRLAALESKL